MEQGRSPVDATDLEGDGPIRRLQRSASPPAPETRPEPGLGLLRGLDGAALTPLGCDRRAPAEAEAERRASGFRAIKDGRRLT